ncbi:MAG TPA: hypothetical protein VKU00_32740 [Chthonomonadaceae bacterium]|nr:hypothetical protein [Chthonomonadaceae bacterium]
MAPDTCGKLHHDDCEAPLREDWQFCPLCGRKNVAVALEGAVFQIDPRQNRPLALRIRMDGHVAISGWVTFDDNTLRCVGSRYFALSRERSLANVMVEAPTIKEEQRVNVYLHTYNGRKDRNPDLAWQEQVEESQPQLLTLRPLQPSRLEVDEALLIFHSGLRERRIHLRNPGDEPLTVTLAGLPLGYRLASGNMQFHLAPQGQAVLDIALDDRNVPRPTETLTLQGSGQSHTVTLYRRADRRNPLRRPRYVVGLDFGTRNSSAILRDIEVEDPRLAVSAIDIPREPTCLYYSMRTGKAYFGEKAIAARLLSDSPDSGIFVERLKEYLILDDEPFQQRAAQLGVPDTERFTVDKLLTRYLQYWKGLIDKTIHERTAGAEPYVHYVFSVPVLDRGPLYHRHVGRMKAALQAAGFPMEDEESYSFVQEPVAAALYFLIGKARNEALNLRIEGMLRKAQLAQGTPFVVIDSGGGTTDVVLGMVKVESSGKVKLEVQATLGLDEDARRFGGADVTDALYTQLDTDWQIREGMRKIFGREFYPDQVKYQLVEPAKIYLNAPNSTTLTTANAGEMLNNVRAVSPLLRDELGTLFKEMQKQNVDFQIPITSLDEIIHDRWLRLESKIRSDVLNGQDASKVFVVLVGGNTHIRAFGQKCKEMFGEQFLIDLSSQLEYNLPPLEQDDKMLAVVGGNAWHYGAEITNLIPYGVEAILKVQYDDGRTEQVSLWSQEAAVPPDRRPRAIALDLRLVRSAEIEFHGKYDASQGRILHLALPQDLCGRAVTLQIVSTLDRIQLHFEGRILGEYLY